jgi:hypothetical protein
MYVCENISKMFIFKLKGEDNGSVNYSFSTWLVNHKTLNLESPKY